MPRQQRMGDSESYDQTGTSAEDVRWDPIPDEVWNLEMGNEPLGDAGVARDVDDAYQGDEPTHLIPAGRVASAPAVGGVPRCGGSARGSVRPTADPAAAPAPSAPTETPANESPVALDRTVVRPQAWEGSRRAARQTSTRAARPARSVATSYQQDDRASAAPDVPTNGGGAARRPKERKHARHGCLSMLLWIVMLGVLALMAARCLPSTYADGRAIPELVSFVPVLFIPIIICLVLSVWWRRRLLMVVTIAALVVMGWWHHGYFLPTARVSSTAQAAVSAGASTTDSSARIMTLNTLNGSAAAEEIVAVCRSQHVEILCLQELTDEMVTALSAAGIDEVLPYHIVSDEASAVSNGGRNGIWTLAPMWNLSYNLLPIETSSMPAATIQIGDRSVRVVSVHPNSPVRGAQDLWESGLSVIGSLSGYDHSYLIMGDFNSTWDHAHFRDLLGESFVDAGEQAGEGFHMTYPANSAVPSLVEIDHIVYSRNSGIVVSGLDTVEISGSDHRALLGTLEVV